MQRRCRFKPRIYCEAILGKLSSLLLPLLIYTIPPNLPLRRESLFTFIHKAEPWIRLKEVAEPIMHTILPPSFKCAMLLFVAVVRQNKRVCSAHTLIATLKRETCCCPLGNPAKARSMGSYRFLWGLMVVVEMKAMSWKSWFILIDVVQWLTFR